MNRIRNRIFVQLLFPILIFYLLIIGGGLLSMGSSYKMNAISQKSAALENIVRGIDDWLLSRVSEVVQLSRIPLFENGSPSEKQNYLKEWQQTLSFHYKTLYLIDPHGAFWSTDHDENYLEDLSYIQRFTEDKSLLLYEGPERSYGIFGNDFIIGIPINDDYNQLNEILTATISLETLQRVFGFFTYEEFDSWMVINPSATIITHVDRQYQGKNEKFEYGQVFLENQEWKDQQVFVKIMRNGWKMVAFLKTENLLKAYRQSYMLIAIYSVILFVILIIFILFLSSTVAKPIKSMTDRVHLIMTGDYKQHVHVNTKDELQELADSFNRLAKRMITLRTDDRFIYLGHISARMAHELRKPLNIIQLASQSLGSNPEKNLKYKNLIDEEIGNADKFISEILNFAHNDNLNKVWYQIGDLLTALVDKYQLIGDQNNVSISLVCSPGIPALYLDIMKMEEVFSNIIQNAVEAISESDSEERWLRISLELSEEKEILITFNDSGPGFDEEIMDQLFDPYFTTRDMGTGLGLALCYRVVTAHNAYISLKNDEYHHGLVKIRFPV